MATVNIALVYRGEEGVPVVQSRPSGSQVITSSASSQQGTLVAVADEYWIITTVGGPIWIKFGQNPTAAAGQDWLVPGENTFSAQAVVGDKVAVINA